MIKDTYTRRTANGHRVIVLVHHRRRTKDYLVRVQVDGKWRAVGHVAPKIAAARSHAQAMLAAVAERLEARPDRRRPHDRRRSVNAYYVDVTPPGPLPGVHFVRREYRCVICGQRNIGNCAMREACPFWEPRIRQKGD